MDLVIDISKVTNPEYQKVLRKADNDGEAGYNGKIDTGKEILQAAEALCKPKPEDLKNAEVCLKKVLGLEKVSKGPAKIAPQNISKDWGKPGITGKIDEGKIIIQGDLPADSEHFTVNFSNAPIPKDKKYLVFDLNYKSREGAWGRACMFQLSVNGASVQEGVKPVNLGTQADGMIYRAETYPVTVKVTLPEGDEKFESITIKTFAGNKILIEISNIRFE